MDVRGKTNLVTGAGRGIGRAPALHFAGKGAHLELLDTNAEDSRGDPRGALHRSSAPHRASM